MATISEFDFKIRYTKGKENRVADALSRKVQVNHLATMNSYGIDLQDRILQVGQQDARYMEIVHRLQQSTGTGIDSSTGIGTGSSIGIGTCSGTCIGIDTCSSTGIGTCSGTGIIIGGGAQEYGLL